MSASWPVQVGVQAMLTSALAVPVYDQAPPEPPRTFVTIGEDTVVDVSSKTGDAQELTLTIHQWDSSATNRQGVKQLQGAIRQALHNKTPSVDGYGVTLCRHEFSESFLDADGITYHGVMNFRVRVLAEIQQ